MWQMVKKLPWFIFALQLACVHVSLHTWRDDLPHNKQRGGYFQYLRHDSAYWEDAHMQQGMAKARHWCGQNRPVGLVHREETTSYRPIATNYLYGNGFGGYGGFGGYDGFGGFGGFGWATSPSWLVGTSTVSYQSVIASRVYFVCQDTDRQQPVAMMAYNDKTGVPHCVVLAPTNAIGLQRLTTLQHQPDNIDCLAEQGWIQVWSDQTLQFFFVGQQGLDLCATLEHASVEALITKEQMPVWLRKQLVCSKPALEKSP